MMTNAARPGLRRGITLTEILISIMIMGIGLVSLATLFPIGLLRLREAQRQTRSAYLYESAAADTNARSLLNSTSFTYADLLNQQNGFQFNYWYYSANMNGGTGGFYNPLVQDRAAYTLDPFDTTTLGFGANSPASGGYGLPFAYDPALAVADRPCQRRHLPLRHKQPELQVDPGRELPRPGSRSATCCRLSSPTITTAMVRPAPMASSGSRTSTVPPT